MGIRFSRLESREAIPRRGTLWQVPATQVAHPPFRWRSIQSNTVKIEFLYEKSRPAGEPPKSIMRHI